MLVRMRFTKHRLGSGLATLACLLVQAAHGAAWRSSGGPDGGNISAIFAMDSILVAGANPGGLYRSSDFGATWKFAGAGTRAQWITGIGRLGDLLIAGSQAGGMQVFALSFSHDLGATWSENKQPWPFMGIEAFTVHKNSLFIKAQQGGLFRSDDTAKTWTSLEAKVPGGNFLNINSFSASGDTLLAATNAGVMMTADGGESWSDLSSNLPDTAYSIQPLSGNPVYCVLSGDSDLYAGTRSAVYRRKKTAMAWEEILRLENDVPINCLFAGGGTILAGTYQKGLQVSLDGGRTWKGTAKDGLTPTWNCLVKNGSRILAGANGYLYRSDDQGSHWTSANSGLTAQAVNSLAVEGQALYAGSWGSGVSALANGAWAPMNNGLGTWSVSSLSASQGGLLAGEIGTGIYARTGNGWKPLPAYAPGASPAPMTYIRDVLAMPSGNLIIGGSGGLFLSQDSGKNLQRAQGSEAILDVNGLYYDGVSATVIVGSNQGIFVMNQALTVNGPKLPRLAYGISGNGKSLFAGIWRGGVFRSDDKGASWIQTSLNLPSTISVPAIACLGDTIYAGTDGLGVFRSTDNGGNWDEFNDGLAISSINALHAFNGKLYAGTDGGGVFEVALDPKSGKLKESFKPGNPEVRLSYGSGKVHLLAAGSSDERLKLEIFDLRGRLVLTLDAPKGRTAHFPFAEPPGLYVARIKSGESAYRIAFLAHR